MSSQKPVRSHQPVVAIFDSGLGGLTIYDAIGRHFPWVELAYCSDNAAFPYGSKPEQDLVERVSAVLVALHQQVRPDILIIACNTASTVALPKIRSLIAEPVIGVVPAIKPAAALAKGTHIALLATPGTVQRSYTQSLIEQFGEGFEWVSIGSSELVQLAEEKMYGRPPSIDAITQAIAPLRHYPPTALDTVVLGCTHFPLLKPELQQILPHIRHWVDSSDAIANRCGFWLHELGFLQGSKHETMEHNLLFTGRSKHEDSLIQLMRDRHFDQLTYLAL